MADPARLEDTRAWLIRARSDLRAGAHDLAAVPPFTGDAAFHAQQAAEKALKAFLAWYDVPFGKTHDLARLGAQCADLDPSFGTVTQRAAALTEYAWKYRYPGEPSEPPREEAEGALALARAVVDAVLARLPAETHPDRAGA